MIAEDNDSNFLLLKALLGKNYQLFRAYNGLEAVRQTANIKPNLILMDIKMPQMDGIEATHHIRESSCSIPIIALTAFALDKEKEKALEAGCTDFITKPFSIKELIEAIEKYI